MSVIGRGDDLVARLGIEGGDGHVDRGGARGAGDDVLDAEQLAQRGLELLGELALGGGQHPLSSTSVSASSSSGPNERPLASWSEGSRMADTSLLRRGTAMQAPTIDRPSVSSVRRWLPRMNGRSTHDGPDAEPATRMGPTAHCARHEGGLKSFRGAGGDTREAGRSGDGDGDGDERVRCDIRRWTSCGASPSSRW